jgi:hypothetical protein
MAKSKHRILVDIKLEKSLDILRSNNTLTIFPTNKNSYTVFTAVNPELQVVDPKVLNRKSLQWYYSLPVGIQITSLYLRLNKNLGGILQVTRI